MPLEDLTPQLRTRLSRMERLVGLFVFLAAVLFLGGFAYYVYQTAERKGWFLRKMKFYTYVRTGAGMKAGDNVKLMGFEVGQITRITAMPPDSYDNVFVGFYIREPYDGYLWSDSRAQVAAGDFLGNRYLEVTKGTNGAPAYLFHPIRELPVSDVEQFDTNNIVLADDLYDATGKNLILHSQEKLTHGSLQQAIDAGHTSVRLIERAVTTKRPTGLWNDQSGRYVDPGPGGEGYFLPPVESPALTERLEAVAHAVEVALPNVLALTNQIQIVLNNASTTTLHADELLAEVRPIVTNLTLITDNLTNPRGSLGNWLLPVDLNRQLTQTLADANALLTNSDARLTDVATSLDQTLDNLANITSNLNAQVRANSNLLGEISTIIIHTDDLVQGLKRHWLLRSAFKAKPATVPPTATHPKAMSPKASER
jgi:hypothetical protein